LNNAFGMVCVVLASCSFARGGGGGGLGLGWIRLFGLSTLAFMGMFAVADEIWGCLGGCRAEGASVLTLEGFHYFCWGCHQRGQQDTQG
jgi:hypothetical protein